MAGQKQRKPRQSAGVNKHSKNPLSPLNKVLMGKGSMQGLFDTRSKSWRQHKDDLRLTDKEYWSRYPERKTSTKRG